VIRSFAARYESVWRIPTRERSSMIRSAAERKTREPPWWRIMMVCRLAIVVDPSNSGRYGAISAARATFGETIPSGSRTRIMSRPS